MQAENIRIEFYVADADEAEKLSKLAQQLSGETVSYSRGTNNWSWPLLPNFSFPVRGKAPWRLTFEFSAEAVRALELLGDSRLEHVRYLESRAKKTKTMH
uniref:hypothetical protein n=1 Tax=Pseudomonas fluorescens TaxID=294 RepID=UPI00155D9F48|nr:hypothetical protein [Pseudomonas fluorescens]